MTNKDLAEKYRQEMMNLYSKRNNTATVSNQMEDLSNVTEDSPQPPSNQTAGIREEANQEFPPNSVSQSALEANENSAPDLSEHTANEANKNSPDDADRYSEQSDISEAARSMPSDNTDSPQVLPQFNDADLDENYPDPDISELIPEEADTSSDQFFQSNAKNTEEGWIQVIVRKGDNAYPIPDASIIINSTEDGQLKLISNTMTDESGKTELIAVPAPNVSYSLESDNNVRPYALYNVSVFADGYFREKSVNVPVFAGITSVQQFNLVPLPLLMKESDETIEIFNQEPDL